MFSCSSAFFLKSKRDLGERELPLCVICLSRYFNLRKKENKFKVLLSSGCAETCVDSEEEQCAQLCHPFVLTWGIIGAGFWGGKSSYNKLTLIGSSCGVCPTLEKAGAKLLLSRGVQGHPMWAAGHTQ